MNWNGHGAVNLHYGGFAAKLGTLMRWIKDSGRPESDLIVTFEGGGPDDPHTRWVMHPALAVALEDLKIAHPRVSGDSRNTEA